MSHLQAPYIPISAFASIAEGESIQQALFNFSDGVDQVWLILLRGTVSEI